jgi:hypothetical protein
MAFATDPSDDLNMSRVIQHSGPCILMQDQTDDHMSICSDLIDSADKRWDTTQAKHNRRQTQTILREDVGMCKCMWVSCNMV